MNRSATIRLFSILAALSFVGGSVAVAFKRPDDAGTMTVSAYFTKTIGLFPQSHVRVLGVSIGRVLTVQPEADKVKVVMRIDASRKVPADARATIVPISLISDRYVQLFPVYTSGPTLADGDVIDIDRTQIPFELDDVLAQLKKLLDAVEAGTRENPESIGAAVRNLASALEGTGDKFATALGGGGELARGFLEHTAQLDRLVVNLSSLVSALAERRGDLAQINQRLAQALGAVASQRDALDSTLANVAVLTEQLASIVTEHRADLEADLTILAKTTQTVLRHQDSVARSLNWLHVLADGAESNHEGGAIHTDPRGPTHVDVRDAHLFNCLPGLPATVCFLLGLTGEAILPPIPPGGATAAAPAEETIAPDPTDLLDGLKLSELLPLTSNASSGAPVRGFFERVGGFLDRAMRWFL